MIADLDLLAQIDTFINMSRSRREVYVARPFIPFHTTGRWLCQQRALNENLASCSPIIAYHVQVDATDLEFSELPGRRLYSWTRSDCFVEQKSVLP